MARAWLRIDGVPLETLGYAYELQTVTWRYPQGCWEAVWQMSLPPLAKPRLLQTRQDAPEVDVMVGNRPIWAGSLPDSDWDTGDDGRQTFAAIGAARDAEEAACLSSAGKTTSRPRLAAEQGIARGVLHWADVSQLPAEPYTDPASSPSETSDETDHLNYIGALLDAYCDENQQSWGVDGHRRAWVRDDPTTPRWLVSPTTGIFGTTREALVGTLFGRYNAQKRRILDTVSTGSGSPEILLDLTPLGPITNSRAKAVLDKIYARTGPVVGWKNGVTVTPNLITNLGGVHPELFQVGESVGAGVMIRLLGQRDPRVMAPYIDVVVGEAIWHVTEGSMELNPRDLVSDDLSAVADDFRVRLVS